VVTGVLAGALTGVLVGALTGVVAGALDRQATSDRKTSATPTGIGILTVKGFIGLAPFVLERFACTRWRYCPLVTPVRSIQNPSKAKVCGLLIPECPSQTSGRRQFASLLQEYRYVIYQSPLLVVHIPQVAFQSG
jgi:hypothetical protein